MISAALPACARLPVGNDVELQLLTAAAEFSSAARTISRRLSAAGTLGRSEGDVKKNTWARGVVWVPTPCFFVFFFSSVLLAFLSCGLPVEKEQRDQTACRRR